MQSKVILICGKICCGKSTYAEKLCMENKAVLLSCDEITLALFDGNLGENHDKIVRKTKNFLLKKSVDIVETGINVILDWGFWTKEERDNTRDFYQSRNILCEFHYIDISDIIWKRNIDKRNNLVLSNNISAYFVDDSLADKLESIFEKPEKDEIDRWISVKEDFMELSIFFKSIIDQDICPIVICNLEHEIIYMNPSAIERYAKKGGIELIGKSLLNCHNEDSNSKIKKVVEWFRENDVNNRIFTFHNPKENKDVYMIALRDESKSLIGYYEKHEYRNTEIESPYGDFIK